MRILIGLVTLALTLSACATHRWDKPGMTPETYERDAAACNDQAERAARAAGLPGHRGWSSPGGARSFGDPGPRASLRWAEHEKGASRGWGQQERLWTHFDGYQVWKARTLRALVGGDARFGGLHQFCSITADDERDELVTRFAVVRRERLVVPRGTPEGAGGEAS